MNDDFETIRRDFEVALQQAEDNSKLFQGIPTSLATINRNLQNIHDQLKEKGLVISSKKEEIASNKDEIKSREEQSKLLDAEIQQSEAEIARLTREKEQLDQNLAVLASELQEQRNQMDELRRQHEKNLEVLKSETNAELQKKDKALQDEIDKMNEEYKEKIKQYEQAQKELGQKEQKLAEDQDKLIEDTNSLQGEKQVLEERIRQLEEKNDSLQGQVTEAKKVMREATDALKRISSNNPDTINEQIRELQEYIHKINEILGSAGAGVSMTKEEIYLENYKDFWNNDAHKQGALKTDTVIDLFPESPVNNPTIAKVIRYIYQNNSQEDFDRIAYRIFEMSKKGEKSVRDYIKSNEKLYPSLQRGGKKTKKRNKKTKRKGRKTKKLRKQRGGFHYRDTAHRRRLRNASSRATTRRSTSKITASSRRTS